MDPPTKPAKVIRDVSANLRSALASYDARMLTLAQASAAVDESLTEIAALVLTAVEHDVDADISVDVLVGSTLVRVWPNLSPVCTKVEHLAQLAPAPNPQPQT